jgi:Regulator of chromosome condensation (RCC1) repeat
MRFKKSTVKKKKNGRTIRRTITVPITWVHNSNAQLGNGSTNDSNTPVQANISAVTDIAAGGYHSLAK